MEVLSRIEFDQQWPSDRGGRAGFSDDIFKEKLGEAKEQENNAGFSGMLQNI